MKFAVLLLLFSLPLAAQISGRITTPAGKPVAGANVFIEGAYDGAASDADGSFQFVTTESGKQTLMVIALGYQDWRGEIDANATSALTIVLRPAENLLEDVVITAGTFEAGEKSRASVLKPLDIVTTAGSAGNIIAALQTLPGTQTVGEDGRLFVRGGEAGETQTFIDGVRVSQPYSATVGNIPTRGRFSPFLFSGISFSTGGYSAEYGEALSGVLQLNTRDEEEQGKTDLSLMTVGLAVGHTLKKETHSVSFNASYIDLTPYQAAVPQQIRFVNPFRSLSGESVYRQQLGSGLLKVYGAFEWSGFTLDQESINQPRITRVDLENNNLYVNASYSDHLGAWRLTSGIGYGYGANAIGVGSGNVDNSEHAAHFKLKASRKFGSWFRLMTGADYFATTFSESFSDGGVFRTGYVSNVTAGYAEVDIAPWRTVSSKAGVRYQYNHLTAEQVVAPRFSIGWRPAKHHHASVAYGRYAQLPQQDFLKFYDITRVGSERAAHYILNYSYVKDKRTLRAEVYHKEYSNLIAFASPEEPESFANSGSGFARGVDLFWRDNTSIRNLEYWVSYSFIDTRRKYRDFPVSATPSFVASHQLSLVTKYWINSLRSQVGLTHTVASGRPYNNPRSQSFMAGRTPAYNNCSASWAYLIDQQKILYFSVSNVFNTANVFGYEYEREAGDNGRLDRRAITPTADRFFFIGFFWTISDDKKSNQLDNL